MRIKPGYILKKVMGSYMVMNTDIDSPDINAMQTLNETGAFLWTLLEQDTTKEAMAEALIKEYEVDKATAERDIEAFVKKLENSNLILN